MFCSAKCRGRDAARQERANAAELVQVWTDLKANAVKHYKAADRAELNARAALADAQNCYRTAWWFFLGSVLLTAFSLGVLWANW